MDESNERLFRSETFAAVRVHASIWDITWILNKTAHLSEDYNIPITVGIERSESIIVVIGLYVAGGIGAGALAELGRDLYGYIKKQAKRAKNRKKGKGEVDVDTNETWKKNDLPYQ